jgi:hypothetical protein
MRVHFERAGGFAPTATRLNYTADTNDLAPADADSLRKLVVNADVSNLTSRSRDLRPQPDAFYYRVTVEDGGGSNSVVASDTDMPPSLRPLVDWLTEQATKNVEGWG